jgi:hypothetical protein
MNQYIVLVFDALLHLSSIFILGFLVSIVVKIFSRGHVDFRLIGGLFIVFVLSGVKLFLEPRIGGYLPGVTPDILLGLLLMLIFIVALILIYWQYSVPLFGALLSAIVVVVLQFFGAYGVPKLSLHLMPDGQRFAEYAGFASEQTSQLMERAKNFENQDGPTLWQKALHSITFLTSNEEKEMLSKDFASGIAVYKERKALMDSMSADELAEYRQAMSEFLEEQGLSENRYSLSNLKNVKPEDLANMASFMNELNSEFDLEAEKDDTEFPSSAESLRKIAKNINGSELSDNEKEIFEKLLSLIDQDDFQAGLEEARAELKALKKDLPIGQLLFSSESKMATSIVSDDSLMIEMQTLEITEEVITEDELTEDAVNKPKPVVARDTTGYVSHTIEIGVLLLHPDMKDTKPWLEAAAAIPYRAWFVGQGEETVTKVIFEDSVLSPGEDWKFEFNGNSFIFHLDEVTEKGIHLSAIESQ